MSDAPQISDMEAARRPFHVSIVHALIVCVRDTARLPSDFEAGLLPLYSLLDLLDKTKIPPAELPGVIKVVYDLKRQYHGQGPTEMSGRLARCVEFLNLYQEEMVDEGKLEPAKAWSESV